VTEGSEHGVEEDLGSVGEQGESEAVLTSEEQSDLLEAEAHAAQVSYSSQDFDANGLVRRITSGDILVPTFGKNDDRISTAGFQRKFVWRRPQMDRFVESILLGYPVPGIFLVRQTDKRYLVLDGQQRLRTLEYFVAGVFEKKTFELQNVADRFKGLTYKTLPDDLRRQFDDTFFQATIVATDGTSESLEAIYQIFERVNSGGTQLTPHEIRVALFAGPMIEYLERLNSIDEWRDLYGSRSARLRDQELVLRIIALFENGAGYKRPLKVFLNSFVAKHRQAASLDTASIEATFREAAAQLRTHVGKDALRPTGTQLNAALTEATFVGLMRRIQHNPGVDGDSLAAAVRELKQDTEMIGATSRATADEESVATRLRIAAQILGQIP
jgi:hypothetical protein